MTGSESVQPMRVCFVCSGNICRSPTAEVVFRKMVEQSELQDSFVIDSAGTGNWHAGADMDERSREVLERSGYHPEQHTARAFRLSDFDYYDLVLAIDHSHASILSSLALQAGDTERAQASIRLLRSYDPLACAASDLEVPDPYYGGAQGFDEVLAQIERACAGLLTATTRPE